MALHPRAAAISKSVVTVAAVLLAACSESGSNPSQNGLSVNSPASSVQPCCREQSPAFEANPLRVTREEPVSTFSMDVDTAAYANVRRMLRAGAQPPPDAIRIEEMINYFDYVYPLPTEPDPPFRASVAMLPNPWSEGTELLHIGVQGHETAAEERPVPIRLRQTPTTYRVAAHIRFMAAISQERTSRCGTPHQSAPSGVRYLSIREMAPPKRGL